MTALRPPVVAGALLVVGGILGLLHAAGLLPGGVPVGPLVLMGFGVVLLTAGTRESSAPNPSATSAAPPPGATAAPDPGPAAAPSSAATQPVTPVLVPTDAATSGRVILNHGAGTLRVGAGSAAAIVEGTSSTQVRATPDRRGDRLEVTLQPTEAWERWPGREGAVVWNLGLATGLPLDVEVRTGASQVRMDLTELDVRSLRIQTGASDVDVVLPAHGHCAVSVSAGAADVRIHVPDGVAASVRNRSALAAFTVDQARFPRHNGSYESPGYHDAADRAEIDIEGGVAAFSVR